MVKLPLHENVVSLIISVHTPKTGGISFRNVLEFHFSDSLFLDYGDFPINKDLQSRTSDAIEKGKEIELRKMEIRQKFRCIHGHFLPRKYATFIGNEHVKFVTWLRDPLERLASHYYFWKRAYDKERSASLHRRIVEEDWSFERFCFSQEMQNIYSNFFWEFPVEHFDFIGITEYFTEDIRNFCNVILGIELYDISEANTNPDKKAAYFTDKEMVRDLRQFHSLDYQIYQFALEQRNLRVS